MQQPTGALLVPRLSQHCQTQQARLRKPDCANKICKHYQTR